MWWLKCGPWGQINLHSDSDHPLFTHGSYMASAVFLRHSKHRNLFPSFTSNALPTNIPYSSGVYWNVTLTEFLLTGLYKRVVTAHPSTYVSMFICLLSISLVEGKALLWKQDFVLLTAHCPLLRTVLGLWEVHSINTEWMNDACQLCNLVYTTDPFFSAVFSFVRWR